MIFPSREVGYHFLTISLPRLNSIGQQVSRKSPLVSNWLQKDDFIFESFINTSSTNCPLEFFSNFSEAVIHEVFLVSSAILLDSDYLLLMSSILTAKVTILACC
jgi:hypothetical protein